MRAKVLLMEMPNLQPTLQSDLLLLRPLAPEDFSELYEAASDPFIWEQHPASDRYKRAVFEKFFNDALDCKGAFAIIDSKDGHIIGSSRYYEVNLEDKEVVIGFTFLTRKYWGGKYNKDLKSLMMNYAFQFFDSILFHVGENNFRSQKAMEKIGGIKVKTINTNIIYKIRK